MAVVEWLRMWLLGKEIAGLNSGKYLKKIFWVTVLLEYLNTTILH